MAHEEVAFDRRFSSSRGGVIKTRASLFRRTEGSENRTRSVLALRVEAIIPRPESTVKDKASNDILRGWTQVIGVTAISLMVATLSLARSERVLEAFAAREAARPAARDRGKTSPETPLAVT